MRESTHISLTHHTNQTGSKQLPRPYNSTLEAMHNLPKLSIFDSGCLSRLYPPLPFTYHPFFLWASQEATSEILINHSRSKGFTRVSSWFVVRGLMTSFCHRKSRVLNDCFACCIEIAQQSLSCWKMKAYHVWMTEKMWHFMCRSRERGWCLISSSVSVWLQVKTSESWKNFDEPIKNQQAKAEGGRCAVFILIYNWEHVNS